MFSKYFSSNEKLDSIISTKEFLPTFTTILGLTKSFCVSEQTIEIMCIGFSSFVLSATSTTIPFDKYAELRATKALSSQRNLSSKKSASSFNEHKIPSEKIENGSSSSDESSELYLPLTITIVYASTSSIGYFNIISKDGATSHKGCLKSSPEIKFEINGFIVS